MKNNKAIATDKLNIEALKAFFRNCEYVKTSDIALFYKNLQPDVKATTINWRIYKLVQKDVLYRVGKGTFIIGDGKKYVPETKVKCKTIQRKINKRFPYLNSCIWHTSVLNEFMQHQPGRYFLIVEVERDATEPVFHFLKENNFQAILEPDADFIDKYLPVKKEAVIIKPLVTEAPTQKIDGINTITIEKLLVDIFCDVDLFIAQQGNEMKHIFNSAMEKYSINVNIMLRYANRRRKKQDLENYLSTLNNF